jgi:hypothetical protein
VILAQSVVPSRENDTPAADGDPAVLFSVCSIPFSFHPLAADIFFPFLL